MGQMAVTRERGWSSTSVRPDLRAALSLPPRGQHPIAGTFLLQGYRPLPWSGSTHHMRPIMFCCAPIPSQRL